MSNLVIIFSPHMLTLLVNYKITEGSLCHKCHAVLTICFAHYNRHNCLLNELITQSHSCCFCIISTFLWSTDKSYQFRWAKKETYYRGTDNNELMWMICRKKKVVLKKRTKESWKEQWANKRKDGVHLEKAGKGTDQTWACLNIQKRNQERWDTHHTSYGG